MPKSKLADKDPSLTKAHFSCKVYQCYFNYLKVNHPMVDIEKVCDEAGLSYSYLTIESNWVSVTFDEQFTNLLIQHTGEPNLCYLAGAQAVCPEVLGSFVSLLVKHAFSLRFIYEHLPALTSAFSRVTEIKVLQSVQGHIQLSFRPLTESLDKSERKALIRNLDNIYQNTIAHYAAIPTAQSLPSAVIKNDYDSKTQTWKIDIQYKSKVRRDHVIMALAPTVMTLLAFKIAMLSQIKTSESFLVAALTFTVCLLSIVYFRYRNVQIGFNKSLSSLTELDQRYRDLHFAHIEIDKISKAYQKFVPTDILGLLKKDSITQVEYGDFIKGDMAILFADLRNFSKMANEMSSTDTFRFLNRHLRRIAPAIQKNHGFIDKYLGDGIMAVFPNSPQSCINAAIDMVKVLKVYNARRMRRGMAPTEIGVGLHTGEMAFGTLGHPAQMQTTVVADGVNRAFRFQDYCKEYHASIITSQELIDSFDVSQFTYRYLATVRPKGTKERIPIFEILDGCDVATLVRYQGTKELFEEAVRAYEANHLDRARLLFAQVLEQNPVDAAAHNYQDKIGIGLLKSQMAAA